MRWAGILLLLLLAMPLMAEDGQTGSLDQSAATFVDAAGQPEPATSQAAVPRPMAVPEPSGMALLAVGVLGIIVRRRQTQWVRSIESRRNASDAL